VVQSAARLTHVGKVVGSNPTGDGVNSDLPFVLSYKDLVLVIGK